MGMWMLKDVYVDVDLYVGVSGKLKDMDVYVDVDAERCGCVCGCVCGCGCGC